MVTLRSEEQLLGKRWSMDFVHDATLDGRAFRVLTVVDQWSRWSPILEVAQSMSGRQVAEALDRAIALHGKPRSITVDHGTVAEDPPDAGTTGADLASPARRRAGGDFPPSARAGSAGAIGLHRHERSGCHGRRSAARSDPRSAAQAHGAAEPGLPRSALPQGGLPAHLRVLPG